MIKHTTDDAQRRATRLQNIQRDFDITHENAVLVDDLALRAAESAADSLLLVAKTAPNPLLETILLIHALRIAGESMVASAELNEMTLAISRDIAGAANISLSDAMTLVGLTLNGGSGETVPGDTCACLACQVRRAALGPDPTWDEQKKRLGSDPGVRLSDVVAGLRGDKRKPH